MGRGSMIAAMARRISATMLGAAASRHARRRRNQASSRGQLWPTAQRMLSADTFFVSSPKSVGKGYLHAVVDTFGSYAFGFLHVSKQPEVAVAVLHRHGKPRPFSTGNHATNVVRIRSVSRAQRPLV